MGLHCYKCGVEGESAPKYCWHCKELKEFRKKLAAAREAFVRIADLPYKLSRTVGDYADIAKEAIKLLDKEPK